MSSGLRNNDCLGKDPTFKKHVDIGAKATSGAETKKYIYIYLIVKYGENKYSEWPHVAYGKGRVKHWHIICFQADP